MSDDAIRRKIEILKSAREIVWQAEAHLCLLIEELFPVTAPIRWKRGAHFQVGTVQRLGYGDSLVVINDRTGVSLKISAHDVISSLEADEEAWT
jgi:hypothetical protein